MQRTSCSSALSWVKTDYLVVVQNSVKLSRFQTKCHGSVMYFFLLSSVISHIVDLEASVPLLPPGLPWRLHRRLRVQTGLQQEVAEHAASHNRAHPILQCAQRRSSCHGRHVDPATAANYRSDCLQVLESSQLHLVNKYEGKKTIIGEDRWFWEQNIQKGTDKW